MKNPFIYIGIALLLAGCTSQSDQPITQDVNVAPRTITVYEAKTGDLASYLEYTGTLEAENAITLSPSATAEITAIHVKTGDTVKQGTLLLTFDETQFHQAKMQFDQIDKNYQRMKDLLTSGSVDTQSFEEMETAWKLAASTLEMARKNTYITAPADGVITDIQGNTGETYNGMMGMPLLTMVSTRDMKANLWITDADLEKIKPAMKVEISVDSTPTVFDGTIIFIAPEAGAMNGLYHCQVMVKNAAGKLRHNQFARLRIITASLQGTIIVPLLALSPDGTVFVVDGDVVHEKTVHIGLKNKYMMAITSGILPGEKVVVKGTAGLQDSDPVTIFTD